VSLTPEEMVELRELLLKAQRVIKLGRKSLSSAQRKA